MKKEVRNMLLVLLIFLGVIVVILFATQKVREIKTVSSENKTVSQTGNTSEEGASQETIDEEQTEKENAIASGEMITGEIGAEDADEAGTQSGQVAGTDDTKSAFDLVFTGDILLSNYVLSNYKNQGVEGVVSGTLAQELKDADLFVANEEFPFSTGGSPAEDKQYTFEVDPQYVSALQELGVDIVTLANNHSLDFGKSALQDTFATLDGAQIAYMGAGNSMEEAAQPIEKEIGGTKLAFLAASRVIPEVSWNIENGAPGLFCTYDGTALCRQITAAKETNDLVIVYVHWGIERNTTPEDYQRSLAQQYIDAGADLVIGSHPHVLQGIEYYNGKPIVYSLGNFIFNQDIEKTAALKVTAENENLTLQLLPAYASGACTQALGEGELAAFYEYMESISYGVSISDTGIVSVP